MIDWFRYGKLHPFPFKLEKAGIGVDLTIGGSVPATSLVNGDLYLFTWTEVGGIVTRSINVLSEVSKVDATNGPGLYLWTPPSAVDTNVNLFVLNMRDLDGGGAFDENTIGGYSHGDALARFNGI